LLAFTTAASAALTAQTPAPDFTLRTAAGGNLRLQEQRGQVVLVNFWASWCGPCRQEMPHLNRLYDKYRASGFVLLGVNIDDDPHAAATAAARWGVKFPVLLDVEKAVSRQYDLGSMPATVLIDRDGRVRYLHRGYREGVEEAYERQIRELVKE
jgi:peroxiredoxin